MANWTIYLLFEKQQKRKKSLCESLSPGIIKDDLVAELVVGDKRLLTYSRVMINPSAVVMPPITVSTTQIVGGPIKSSSFICIATLADATVIDP